MMMKAVRVHEPGDTDQLNIDEIEKPRPGPGEVLVRVRATALNRADILQREGRYPVPPGVTNVLGLEMAGIVEEVADDVTIREPGDRVMSLLPGGGYAEYVTVSSGLLMSIPHGFTFEEAAAIPEAYLTAYQALFWLGRLKEDERTLIHAGGSGVGTAAIQLARNAGACVAVTAGRPEKLESCRALGAELAINYNTDGFATSVSDKWGPNSVDVILDFIGAPYWSSNIDVLALDGRIIELALMGGPIIEQFDLRALFRKRGSLIMSTLRSRSDEYKTRLTQAFSLHTRSDFASGRLKPVVDRIFSLDQVADAHRYMEENRNIGKIVLRVS